MSRFTAYIAWSDTEYFEIAEEIDVDADSKREAYALAEYELERFYKPGGRIVRVVERFGLYL